MADEGVSWAAISAEFDLLCVMASDLNFPSEDEIDGYKASLVAPHLVKSNLRQRLAEGKLPRVPKGGDGPATLENAIRILRSEFVGPPPPQHLAPYFQEPVAIVKEAIAKQRLSLDFVWAWGRLQEASGHIHGLLIPGGALEKRFWDGFGQAKKLDVTLQQYWYAHWMVAHGFFDPGARREEIKAELAELCSEIIDGQREARVHPKEWFADMIAKNPADPESWSLKTTYTRLPPDDIRRMRKNRLIPLSALPPLSGDEFPAIP